MIRRHRRIVWLVYAAITFLAVGCQPLPHPFDEDRPPAALLQVPDSFDIAVGPVEGEPAATAAKLPAAIAQELLKHNIAASDETTNKGSYKLDGRIELRPDKAGRSLVTVFWRLRDPRGNVVRERSDKLAAPTRDWRDGNDDRVAELAAASAKGFAAVLVDETPKESPGPGRVRVAVRKIEGAPGDGNDSLASSLKEVLKHQDVELVDPTQGRPDLAVDADVKIDPAKDGKQHVKIVWHVARASGGEIGQVAQENDIPKGRLDGPWGDVAFNVVIAAQGGIMQLVDRGTPQKLGAEATAAALPPALPGSPPPSAPAGPPAPGNIDSPAVNLPAVNVTPSDMPKPLGTPDVPVLLPYRGVPIPH